MNLKNFWKLKKIPLGPYKADVWHIVDGNDDIVEELEVAVNGEYDCNAELYQAICNAHNICYFKEAPKCQ